MRRLVPRSLTARLVVTAVTLVAVVSLLVGTVTTLGMHAWLTNRLDSDVAESLRPGPGGRVLFGSPGTLQARFAGSARQGEVVRVRSNVVQPESLDSAVLSVLAEVGSEPTTVDLPGLGKYRVMRGRDERSDFTVVAGLPTEDVDEATMSLIRLEIVLALLGIVAAGLAGTAVVRRQLRPLTEVAATAHAVAELPLAEGDIGVTERVPEHLTDPRTEAGQVGLALNQLLEHVESSLSARHRSELQVRQFVADASHELRTPLTTIAGYTELARRRGDAATSAVALAKVEEEAGRMTALVEDLLLLARLDAGRPLAAEPVDLTRLLLEAVDDARVVAPEHRWRIVLPADGEPVETVGDEHRLHQVVTNLLTNARKYTPAGTTVTVTVRRDGFDVHDDGPGFPAGLVDTAFERFTRGDASRHRSDGVGLGLALVQAIVSAHGGTVALRSVPGDTRITVALTARP
ncbi:sensor histidine kinase [Nocardioides nitrophenolicus]|uniref:sensor histidine kinase n=1 Tax=Nocardioides nitrophenolicus TaxID=60489 RepID=UPI00195BC0A6|nr:HAMP domain-containing sensor histidine kinase [Nocardioides nitrophenolicus]MBM7519810.1 two-component system OmpR family sensor kinase [Nocardioides nitrophenolicus]